MTSTNKVYVIKVMTKREGGGDGQKSFKKTDDVFYELPYLVFFLIGQVYYLSEIYFVT